MFTTLTGATRQTVQENNRNTTATTEWLVVCPKIPWKVEASSFPSSSVAMEMLSAVQDYRVSNNKAGSEYHPFRSRLPVDTTVVVKRSHVGSVLTGVIRQIMQDPKNKERFRYFIRSKPKFAQYYEEPLSCRLPILSPSLSLSLACRSRSKQALSLSCLSVYVRGIG
jgi:hypothetical protein